MIPFFSIPPPLTRRGVGLQVVRMRGGGHAPVQGLLDVKSVEGGGALEPQLPSGEMPPLGGEMKPQAGGDALTRVSSGTVGNQVLLWGLNGHRTRTGLV